MTSRTRLYNPTMHSIAELELDSMRMYEADISVIAELSPVPAVGTETSAALAARVDATQLRQYGQQMAANWELLARFLEYLEPRGWRFKGASGDGVTAYAIIARHGKPGELHADLSALPTDLRDWLTNEGGIADQSAGARANSLALDRGADSPTGWECFEPDAGWS
jgi:hypothetical protein